MAKSFAFVIFLLGVLIAQITCARPSRSNSNKTVGSVGGAGSTGSSSNDDDEPWLLPGFDKSEISRFGKNNKKCWYKINIYYVCLTRNQTETKLLWRNTKFDSEVKITVPSDGEVITQEFDYDGGHVALTQMKDGSSTQTWVFGPDKFNVRIYPDGTSQSKWFGSEHPEYVEKLKKFVNLWCENNDFFVGKENCGIHDKIQVNTDPAWILSGFDKNQVNQLNKNEKKCWTGNKYHVCLNKRNGTKLIWKNERSKVRVEMDVYNGGSIFQDFTFEDNHIQIHKLEDHSIVQQWVLKSSRYEVRKRSEEDVEDDDDENVLTTKWYGDEDPERLKKAQDFINAWCENNDFFIKKEDCLIYKI